VVTTIDPATVERGIEPLRTLATYRRGPEGSVLFGVNATPAAAGSVSVGDELAVLAFKDTTP
jgi:uncharacterized protein YcbX